MQRLLFLALVTSTLVCTHTSVAQQRAAVIMPAQQVPEEVRQAMMEQMGQIERGGMVMEEGGPSGPSEATVDAPKKPDARKKKMEARLKKLQKLSLNRLPSRVLETWSKPLQITDEKKKAAFAELPPAPEESFLYDDLRFDIAKLKLERDFTLGNWQAIKDYMNMLPEKHRGPLYSKVLTALSGSQNRQLPENKAGGSQADSRTFQNQFLSFEDVFEIAGIAPEETEKDKTKLKQKEEAQLRLFSRMFQQVLSRGAAPSSLIERCKTELESDAPAFSKRQLAKILVGCSQNEYVDQFLPELEQAKKDNDNEALNMLSNYTLSKYAKDKKTVDLEYAWNVTQAILAAEDVDKDERTEALKRAVSLSGKVRQELGAEWLNESFVVHEERGMEVLSAIGSDAAKSMISLARSAEQRLNRLRLQKDAVAALLEASPGKSKEWKTSLEMLAENWLREAKISYTDDQSSSLRPNMQRDMFGNMFYFDDMYYNERRSSNRRFSTISVAELLEVKPTEKWLELVDPSIRPKFDMILAQLYLKVSEEDEALPYIEKLSTSFPKQAESLIDEFLRVWTQNHNPNSARQQTNAYMFMYGYESRAESIPLTRSKQQRNLEELSALVPRLKALSEKDLDQDLLLSAFVTCHSVAEVYQTEQIERIFGSLEKVKPEVMAGLSNTMRSNLARLWRDAAVQKKSKTKRRKKEIEAEVLRGYDVARTVVDDALKRTPDEWSLMAADAALIHDENNYRGELKNSSEFAARRKRAMDRFQEAARSYVNNVAEMEEKDYSTDAFDTWFYASLGACDLALIDEKHLSAVKQPAAIRELLEDMPEKQAEWHMNRFANLLFTRLSSVKPHLKHRYLDAGFEIVGDNKQAIEARKVHEYYKDLVSEIQLETVVDGPDEISTKPFGVFVNLLHTKEIERESGGFGRYLQNQNNSGYFSYNYGRPTEDYRDKFDESARELLNEHFEVKSITFQKPDVKSVPAGKDGWRVTPYAYLLLQARRPDIDRLPPLKINLDFLDTSGYAILPVESAAIPVVASEEGDMRPHQNLDVTQILDERQADEGKLVLEIKAVARGLVPELDQIMEVDVKNFEVTGVEDQGVSVTQFDEEADGNVVMSDRTWVVSLEAVKGVTKPKSFQFPEPAIETNEVVFQRYVDADLETVESSISLEEKYGKRDYRKIAWFAAAGLIGFILLCLGFVFLSKPTPKRNTKSYDLGDDPSPFTVISMLQDIKNNNGLNEKQKRDLGASINQLEEYYFAENSAKPAPDLDKVARKWMKTQVRSGV